MLAILLQAIIFVSLSLGSLLPKQIYKFIKWILHCLYGCCEIECIFKLRNVDDAFRVGNLERSLKGSKFPQLNGLANAVTVKTDDLVSSICEVKTISPTCRSDLALALGKITSYNRLTDEVESTKCTSFVEGSHNSLLVKLWSFAFPDQAFARISNQWKELGFQGNDPATDFRGMGILGLLQLHFLAENGALFRRLYSLSSHPMYGFPFAITSINVTALAVRCLNSSSLKPYFYNAEVIDIDEFNRIYCYLFDEFVKFWFAAKPKSIMEFNSQMTNFEKEIVLKLRCDVKSRLAIADCS